MDPQEQARNKSILIIKAKAKSLAAAETFLRNRDWKIASTDNLKDALAYVVQHKPQFVMISVDHPNNKVRSLPKVLTQAFPVCVIAFAENNSSASYRLLAGSSCEYKVNPPVTGPAVERTVNKYYKDLEKKNSSDASEKAKAAGNDAGDNSISVKGGNAGGMVSIKGSNGNGKEAVDKILSQMMKEDGSDSSDGGFFSGDNSGPAYNPQQSKQNQSFENSFPSGDDNPDDEDFNGFYTGDREDGTGATGSSSSNSGPAYNPYAGRSGGPNSPFYNPQDYGSNANGTPPAGFVNTDSQNSDRSPLAGSLYDPAAQSSDPNANGLGEDGKPHDYGQGPYNRRKLDNKGHGVPSDGTDENKPHNFGEVSTVHKKDPNQSDSIILKGTKEALEKSVISSKHKQKVQKLEESSNVACIVVESPRFSGYLVTALGKNRKIDEKFLKGVHERLFSFLKANGEEVKNDEAMDIKIKEVPFEDWAMDCAEFLRKSVHDGDEVAMAFFPYANAKATLHESANSEMAAVNIEELDGDRPVEMNLYVYLPVNQKYILYTPRGGKFYSNQKEKLMRQGVKQMHLLKAEADDMNKYRAQNYLNAKIEEFEACQQKKKAS